MAFPETPRRLIVNADDFGRSPEINEAVVRAHREGILTTASLMVNEPYADEAITLARANPRLGVGLHLSLVCGRSALSHSVIPALTDGASNFSDNAVTAGCRYFFSKSCREQLQKEMAAQFEKFRETGLPLDHVNGHLNMHLHPVVLSILCEQAAKWDVRAVRLTRDPFFLNARLAGGQWFYRSSHALIYHILSARARGPLQRLKVRHTENVFGLLQNGRVEADFIQALIPRLPPGDSELYSHPSLHQYKNEFEALIHPALPELVRQNNIRLIRYQDL